MRRSLAVLVTILLFLPALVVTAQTENLRDDFGSVSYSGNDGSLDFSAPWSEIGESDGPGSGQVRVADQSCSNNMCLQMRGGLIQGDVGASRAADLTTFSNATLQYDVQIEAALLSTATLYVEARDASTGWTTLKSYALLLEAGAYSEELDISAFLDAGFRLRFRLTNLLGGDRVYIDRVNIEGPVAATTTSSTSTTTTSTSSSSTSSSSSSSTTTGPGGTTTSSSSTTTTTRSTTSTESSSTTTVPASTTTTADAGVADGSTTTTTSPAAVEASPTGLPPDGLLRQPSVGLVADYRPGMMGEIGPHDVDVLNAELDADFSLAVEVIEEARIWIAILALIIAAALVGGMDARRARMSPSN